MRRKREIDNEIMRLIDAEPGMELEICELPLGNLKTQFVRLGVTEGSKVRCSHRLPGGTIIITKRHQEIAVGSEIAKKILVKKI
ncbi:FeoA family protein [Candidatus Chrysopegis kryptomonas]|jgi:ferrous iron transport protein A|uniref:FeoA domain-containing protein n=1 Tax=Candidatus Chryseopegocella kryptomonas TaxID=1633643 RepID=A0A0P1P3F8_9BACT|nr:ferrous iron transport protein A [Candidatus Chrysopegis kryptomonas]CUT05088.1 FeoA domain-containing protein [Candidatus Chrysopegis kryptomonas]